MYIVCHNLVCYPEPKCEAVAVARAMVTVYCIDDMDGDKSGLRLAPIYSYGDEKRIVGSKVMTDELGMFRFWTGCTSIWIVSKKEGFVVCEYGLKLGNNFEKTK